MPAPPPPTQAHVPRRGWGLGRGCYRARLLVRGLSCTLAASWLPYAPVRRHCRYFPRRASSCRVRTRRRSSRSSLKRPPVLRHCGTGVACSQLPRVVRRECKAFHVAQRQQLAPEHKRGKGAHWHRGTGHSRFVHCLACRLSRHHMCLQRAQLPDPFCSQVRACACSFFTFQQPLDVQSDLLHADACSRRRIVR